MSNLFTRTTRASCQLQYRSAVSCSESGQYCLCHFHVMTRLDMWFPLAYHLEMAGWNRSLMHFKHAYWKPTAIWFAASSLTFSCIFSKTKEETLLDSWRHAGPKINWIQKGKGNFPLNLLLIRNYITLLSTTINNHTPWLPWPQNKRHWLFYNKT